MRKEGGRGAYPRLNSPRPDAPPAATPRHVLPETANPERGGFLQFKAQDSRMLSRAAM